MSSFKIPLELKSTEKLLNYHEMKAWEMVLVHQTQFFFGVVDRPPTWISKIHLQMEFCIHLSLDFKLTKAEKAHLHKKKYEIFRCVSLIEKIPPEREKESQPLEPISHGMYRILVWKKWILNLLNVGIE